MPAAIDFATKDTKFIVRTYNNGTETLATLADTYGVSQPVIRRLLTANGVVIMPRGRRPLA